MAGGADYVRSADRQIFEAVSLTRSLVPLDLDTVLLPDPVRHDLAAHLGLLVGPGLLHREERPLAGGDERVPVELGVVGLDGGQAIGHLVVGRWHGSLLESARKRRTTQVP